MRWLLSSLLSLLVVGQAQAGQLDASWLAPQTNVDGSTLIDLASYRVYYALFPQSPCPGTQFIVVLSTETDPSPGATAITTLGGLTQGMTYNAQVTAVDTAGNESACSSVASAVARPDSRNGQVSNVQVAYVSTPTPVGADFTTRGMANGLVVKGFIEVEAFPALVAGQTLNNFKFAVLRGTTVAVPDNQEAATPFCFIGDPGTNTVCMLWNSASQPNGSYTFRITMSYREGTVTKTLIKTFNFTISN